LRRPPPFPLPDALPISGPSDVIVRVRAAGVNPVDTYIHTGTYPRKPNLPYTPGNDGAGTVESVGAQVTGLKPGDRVYICGDNQTDRKSTRLNSSHEWIS